MRSFSRNEVEEKLIELGGNIEGNLIKSEKWIVEILEEREEKIGKITLNAVIINIKINQNYKKEFLGKFRIKFSRGGG